MFKITGTTIRLTRGDSFFATVVMKNQDGTSYQPQTGDEITFTLKKYYTDDNALLTKSIDIDTLLLSIDPEDTEDLPFGWYVYDICLVKANGDVDTFIYESDFEVAKEAH